MKKIALIACIAMVSCSKKDNYQDISSVGISQNQCPNAPIQASKIFLDHDYAFDVTDDSIFVYTEDNKLVGGVKIEGQLDSLVTADNE